MPGTYGKTSWRGMKACGCMIQSIEDVIEPRLRAAGLLGEDEQVYGIQGAYNGTVSASGGTHDEGGALDHGKGSDAETRIWRESGWADWQRGSPEDPHFDDHNHGIVIGCPHLSPAAADQVYDYKNGRNGLADGGPDQSPHVSYVTWQEAYEEEASMALSDDDVARIANAVWKFYAVTTALNKDGSVDDEASSRRAEAVLADIHYRAIRGPADA